MAIKGNLPSVTSEIPRDLRTWTDRVRESLEQVQTAQETATTTVVNYYGPGAGGGSPTWQPGDPLPCGYPVSPLAPTGLTVDPGFGFFLLTWDQPTYCGHSYTEVWGLRNDDLGAAVLLGSSIGTTYSHLETEQNAYWCFWLRHVNVLGQAGPYNQTEGVCAQTALDPEYLLSLLRGRITESQLYRTLSERLDGIEPIQTQLATTQDDLGRLSAQYTVKIDAGGHIAGFGLASTAQTEGPNTSRFIVRADEFSVAGATTVAGTAPTSPYTGQAWLNTTDNKVYYWTGLAWSTDGINASVPFVVRTAPVVINGETVPAGVYLQDAYIANGTITTAKIGNAVITDAKILSLTASKLTSGSMAVDTYIQSGNFVTGSTGWKLWTNASGAGFAEFNGGTGGAAVTVRGTIYADAGWFKGSILGGAATSYGAGTGFFAGLDSGVYKLRVGTAANQRVTWDGTSLSVRGTIQADAGYFKGCILGGDATAYATGNGFYAGFGTACATGGTYYWRVGTPANQRVTWDGTNLAVYNASNQLMMRVGSDAFFSARDKNGVERVRMGIQNGSDAGLSIWDGSGNPIMTPGGTVDGYYVKQLSIGTLQIADVAVTNAKIANLAVTNAKIADAAINTLKVAGGSVTAMNYGETISTVALSDGGSATLASCSITMPTGSSGLTGIALVVLELLDGSGIVFNASRTVTLLKDGVATYASYSLFGGSDVLVVSGFDADPSGTHTYAVRVSVSGFRNVSGGVVTGATVKVLKSHILITGGKR